MAALLIYSLKLSMCLGVIYLFYYLVLRKLTFYNWNRYYLLIGTGLSFLLPLVNVLPFLESPEVNSLKIIRVIPTLNNLSSPVLYANHASNSFGDYWYYIIPVILGLGVFIQAVRLTIQFISFFRLRQSAVQLQNGAINIYQVEEEIAPFSFGNAIFLNKNLLQSAELEEIIRHEKVHIDQKHTLDVLLFECVCLVNWFNPFAWLLKLAVRQNLEFIVDRAVLVSPALDKKYYQYLLLKVIGLPNLKIANQFNISSLKTRIMMMNKLPSNKRELAKFLFVLPMMAVLVLACQDDADKAFKDLSRDKINIVEMTEADAKDAGLIPDIPDAPPPPPPPPAVSNFNFDDFLKQNPTIKNFIPEVRYNEVSSMVIELKSEKRETYNLKNNAELAQFRQRYGNFPVKNLPPPPPPVVLPNSPDHTLFVKRNPHVELLGWQDDKTAVIFLKSGEREEYDLNNPESKSKAEKKYGKLPEFKLPEGVTKFTPPVIKKISNLHNNYK